MPPAVDVAEYCREIETHLTRKNDGHLMRIVGPSFEVVSGWATSGVPIKVALAGIDRYFERYYRKAGRRRPVKIDFCDADVLDVFDEWRRATGVSVDTRVVPDGAAETAVPHTRSGPSLPEHLQRALLRLSALRVNGTIPDAADRVLDAVSAALDAARAHSGGVRGTDRRDLLDRLNVLDAELLSIVQTHVSPELLSAVRQEALADLAAYRATMTPDAFTRAVERAQARALRERLGLPVVAFGQAS